MKPGKEKSRCEPLRRLHGVLSMRFQVCYSPAPTLEMATAAASRARGALRGGGGSAEKDLAGREQSLPQP